MPQGGPYSLIRKLAVGGMAEIFLARRSGPAGFTKTVALKRILPHLSADPEFVAMFLDEARITTRLNHPHIVQLHDFGEMDGSYFLALEFVAGEDVHTILRHARERSMVIPPAIVATILAAACEALHYAHELHDEHGRPLGIVHRDVTPSNLLVSYDGVVKLADFGIAKAAHRVALTSTRSPKGKYPYMSPEQALGQQLDRRSDLFSLATVGHELLTGRRLFERASELAILKAITDEPIPRPSSLNSNVPRELDDVIMAALERAPDRRFPSARAMQVALEHYLSGHGLGSKIALSAYVSELFGEEKVSIRRRWAAGQTDDDALPTVALGSRQTPEPRPRRRMLWGAGTVAIAIAGSVIGVQAWQSRGREAVGQPPLVASSVETADEDTLVDAHPREREMRSPGERSSIASSQVGSDRASTATLPPGRKTPSNAPQGSGATQSTSDRASSHTSAARQPASTSAYLSVDVGAQMAIALDGRRVGTTPLHRHKIPPGRHTIALRGSEGNVVVFKFAARAGEEHVENQRLGAGNLTIDVTPWADVFVGQRKLGTTPIASVPLPEGRYSLRLINPELGREKTFPVTVRPGETARVKTGFD